ncbi:MAG: hypothetical protein SPK09_01825 [Porphyromonas sp.]|nr:hypothetical protein [Porphyromonas sp.]
MNQPFSRLGRRAWAMLGVACLATFGSCSKDDLSKGVKPQASVDERKSKAHGDPVKAVLTLYSGHLHGIMGFHQNSEAKDIKHLKRVQTMHISYTPTGSKDENGRERYAWTVLKGPGLTEKFKVEYGKYGGKDKDHPTRLISTYQHVYGLLIRYYDANGNDITNEFVTKGQEDIHQHFFIPNKIKPWHTDITWNSTKVVNLAPPYDKLVATRYREGETLLGKKLPKEDWKPFYYFYSDTNPLDQSYKASITGTNIDVKFLGFDNPMGFKGWFGFNNPLFDEQTFRYLNDCIYVDFEIGIKLLHAATHKTTNSEDGKTPSPYDMPSDRQLQNDLWDVHLSVPVLIYASQEDMLSIDYVEIDDPRTPGAKKKTRRIQELGRQPRFEELRDFSKDYVIRISKAYGITKEEAIADLYQEITAASDYESGALFF